VLPVVVFYELCVFLIDTEVGQVNKFFVQPLRVQVVLFGGEPNQAIIVYVDFKWVKLGNQNVDSEIILKSIY